jgi:hypothetical protein
LRFKLGRREIIQRGVNPLVSIDSIQEPPQLVVGITRVLILRQVHFILFDRAAAASPGT